MNQNLKYFIGKVCSIFTLPISRNFKEESPETYPEQPYLYFIGVVEAVDDQGILVTQVTSGLKSYFFKQALVAIAEEQVLDPSNEKDAAAINQIKQANETVRDQLKKYEQKSNEYVDPDQLTSMLKQIKNGPAKAK
jgi:hypothetical protein